MYGFLWAAEHGIDVVSISFGGYLGKSDPFQAAAYDLYGSVVAYATELGTTIVSSAGNEHVKIGTGGKVMSHRPLTAPPGLTGGDLFGLYEVPGGLKGVVDVSSTGNVVNAPSATCPTTNGNYSTVGAHSYCEPTADLHQPFGTGTNDQLTYYSNYGPRIDVVGPGGARKSNLPVWDRGETEGGPFAGEGSYAATNDPGTDESSTDGFNAWEDFSIQLRAGDPVCDQVPGERDAAAERDGHVGRGPDRRGVPGGVLPSRPEGDQGQGGLRRRARERSGRGRRRHRRPGQQRITQEKEERAAPCGVARSPTAVAARSRARSPRPRRLRRYTSRGSSGRP